MMRQGIWITLIFELISTVHVTSGKRYLFHLPWACSVLHSQGGLVGACAILTSRSVLVSVDSFNETVKVSSGPPVRFLEVIEELFVYAGSNFMDPSRLPRSPPSYQKKKASKLHVAFKVPEIPDGSWEFKTNPEDISEKAGFDRDVFGLAFNIGILELRESFIYTEYVEPILFNAPDIHSNEKNFLKKLENAFYPTATTCITYSWSRELNTIRYHEVVFVKNKDCVEAYCYWKLSNCYQFPNKYYLSCFRSVVYADVCPSARGAALYCPKFNQSVFAILTTAPSCGQRHLSGVYTTLTPALELYEKVYKKAFEIPGVQYKLYELRQANSDYDGVP